MRTSPKPRHQHGEHGIPWNLIAARLSGDIGGVTIYTDRFNRKVVYPIAAPDKPPSPKQIARRNRFRIAQASWTALSSDQKNRLEQICSITGIPLTGQNLYISAALNGTNDQAQAVARQAGIPIDPIPHVP